MRAVEPSTGAVVSQCVVDLSKHVTPDTLFGEMLLTMDANSDIIDDQSRNERCASGKLEAKFELALADAFQNALEVSTMNLSHEARAEVFTRLAQQLKAPSAAREKAATAV